MSIETYGLPQYALEQLRSVFSQWPEIETVLLYGSRATGTYRANSDIDLTLCAGQLDFNAQLKIENQIDDLLLPWGVDLSLLHLIDNAALRDNIERDGVVFYQRNSQTNSIN